MSRTAHAEEAEPPKIPSPQDIEDAEDILFTRPPRQVAVRVCACGEAYPCEDVRWAQLIKAAARELESR